MSSFDRLLGQVAVTRKIYWILPLWDKGFKIRMSLKAAWPQGTLRHFQQLDHFVGGWQGGLWMGHTVQRYFMDTNARLGRHLQALLIVNMQQRKVCSQANRWSHMVLHLWNVEWKERHQILLQNEDTNETYGRFLFIAEQRAPRCILLGE